MTNAQKDKQQRVEQIVTNIPVGTQFQECYNGYNGTIINNTGVVIGHTKTGNIKLETKHGVKMKTKYHFQCLDKSFNFQIAGGAYRHFVQFV